MAKNPREPKDDRRATDGGICVIDVSPALIDGELKPGKQAPEGGPQAFDILLTKVNMGVIDLLSIGSRVTFERNGRELSAYSKGYRIGNVAHKDQERVTSAIATGGEAWIRDIYDKGLAVRVEC